MLNNTTISRVLVSIITLAAVANATFEIIEPIPGGGSGGGGQSGPLYPQYVDEACIRISNDWNGLSYDLRAENNEEQIHTWETEYGYEEWTEPQHSSGDMYFTLEQGFMGEYYLPLSPQMRFRERIYNKYDNEKEFSLEATWKFLFTDKIVDWQEPPKGYNSFNAFGIDHSEHISLKREEEWIWNGEDDWTVIEGDNIRGNFGFYFKDTLVESADVRINQYTYWDNNIMYPGIEIAANFDLEYLGDYLDFTDIILLPDFPDIIIVPQETLNMINSVPEPATLALLLTGGLAFIRRRRS